MAGSFLDDFLNNPFGGLFDFNGDGKEDIGELWFGYKMLEEAAKAGDPGSTGFSFDEEQDDSWRDFCEDGSAYGLDPEDYETEEEYEDALEEARLLSEDGSGDGFGPDGDLL